MAGLYIHIPFCKQACYYCDFHFSTDTKGQEEMADALIREIALQKAFLTSPLNTIYFGGGTPSLIHTRNLERILEAAKSTFLVTDDAEITLEANPDDLSRERLVDLRTIGINRLSIGIQSFNDDLLKYLHRAHDATAAHQCLNDSADAGFDNVSLDLIYAIPGLDREEWMRTLKQALHYKPAHLSSYALTIEDKTVFGNWQKKGRLSVVAEESAAQQFELLQITMEESGYDHYEISNFCRPGLHSRHNSSYWMQEHYLGIGPSAHSYDGVRRYFNIRNNALYVKSLAEGLIPATSELLTTQNKINEYILTRLRTHWGCDLQVLNRELGDDLMVRCGSYINRQQDLGFLHITDGVLRLTGKGKLLADQITEDLMT